MAGSREADPSQAFRTGLLVILFMPSDLIVMLAVATNGSVNMILCVIFMILIV